MRREPDRSGPGWRLALRVAAEDHPRGLAGGLLGAGALAAVVRPLLGAALGWAGVGAARAGYGAVIWAVRRTWRPEWAARERARFDTALTRLADLGPRPPQAPALPDASERT